MSIASRRAKCLSRSSTCAGHEAFGQRRSTSPSAPHGLGPAHRAALGRRPRLGAGRPLLEHDRHHLRDHLAAPLDPHRVALPHVLAGDLLLVVERGAAHGGSREEHRLEVRDGRQAAGAAHLHLDRAAPPSRPAAPGTCRRSPSAGTSRSSRAPAAARSRPPSPRRRRSRTRAPRAGRARSRSPRAPRRCRRSAATRGFVRKPQERSRSSACHWLVELEPAQVGDPVQEHLEAPLLDDARVEALHRAGRGVPAGSRTAPPRPPRARG